MILDRLQREQELHRAASPGTIVLLGYRGSVAHGMYVPNTDPNSIDDIDLMGVVVPDKAFYLGLPDWGSHGTIEIVDHLFDIVLYELRKVLRLLAAANPNVLSLLWLEPQDYLIVNEAGRLLLAQRDLFMTRAMFPAFTGYAYSQLKKMESGSFEGYMGDKRKQLVLKYGYDCKNAAHLIRLLKMGIEAAETGQLQVKRHEDAEELLAIKRGEWSLERVKETANDLFAFFKEIQARSTLDKEPDMARINDLCIQMVESCHSHD